MKEPPIKTDEEPVDLARLRLVAETPEEEKALMEAFSREAVPLLQLLERSDGEKEWKRAAHSLYGAAANLGMDALARYCRQAEEAAHPTHEIRTQILANIKAELLRVTDFLAAR